MHKIVCCLIITGTEIALSTKLAKEISSKWRDVELKPLSKGNSRQWPGGGVGRSEYINIYIHTFCVIHGYFILSSCHLTSAPHSYGEKFYFQSGLAINYPESFKYTLIKYILIGYGGTCLSLITTQGGLRQEDCHKHEANSQYIMNSSPA